MYKIEHFEDKFCGGDCYRFVGNNYCDEYSIWQFCFWNRWWFNLEQLVVNPENLSLCGPEWFALIFWLSLVASLAGIYKSARKFLSIYYGSWDINIYRKQGHEKYQRIPRIFQRNLSLVGSVIMIRAWTGLLIGIITVTPSAISTWLTIFSVTIFSDLIQWIGVTLFVKSKLDFRSCCKHLMPVGVLLMVRCIQGVFVREIERRANIEELKLISKLTKKW